VYRLYHVRVCDVFDTERDVSARVHVFGRARFNLSKICKPKHICLRHVTRLVRRIKCVRVYTCLTRVNTYSIYKFNKFQIKLEKYIKKIEWY
jgi:hypothetical protein